MIQNIDYAAISPLLIVAVAGVAVLLADAFDVPRRILGWATAGGLAGGLVAVAVLAVDGGDRATFCVPSSLGGARGCSYLSDQFTLVFQGLVLAAALVVVLMSAEEIARREVPAGEYHFLILCAVSGAVALAASRDLVLLVVALETLTLPIFALVALRRYDGRATEAAVKLFLVSIVSAAILLFGISLVYGTAGSMNFEAIAAAQVQGELKAVLSAGIVLVIAGLGFKVAAVPFHTWTPDVYEGAPVPVAAFLSVVSKAGGFAALVLVVTEAFGQQDEVWRPLLAVLAAVTMTVGNVMALRQAGAVRLLAWSSVAQSGYMIAPLAVEGGSGAASIVYLAFYSVMNLGAFAVVSGIGGRLLDDYRGLARTRPGQGIALAFFLVCLAGLPPGVMGLIAKIAVFGGLAEQRVPWLAAVMALNTVVGLYYYLTWAARLFAVPSGTAVRVGSGVPHRLAVGVTLGGAVLLSVAPQALMHALVGLY